MRRRLDPEARRQQILEAATRAFATRPYDDVLIETIAREAGASRALVNHYFGDKRSLFIAVARHLVGRIPQIVRTDLQTSPEEMVAANTAAWLDSLEANREAALVFLGAGPIGHDAEFEALTDTLRDQLVDRMLLNHLGTTDVPRSARATLRAATGLMQQAARDWLLGKGGTRDETQTLIVHSILAVVRDVLPAVTAVGTADVRS